MCCKLRKKLILLMAILFIAGIGFVGNHYLQYGKGQQVQNKAIELAAPKKGETPPVLVELTEPGETPLAEAPAETEAPIPPDEEATDLALLDISPLQTENADVIGWIRIPGTKIDYPLLSSDSSDEYLHTAWDGSYSYSGSIYLECQNSTDLSDFHTLIYGHNMKNGTMFGNLIGYSSIAFRNEHPYVYLLTGNQVYRYEIFAAYTADVQSDTYRIGFQSDARKAQAISYYQESSVIRPDVNVDSSSRILTLSTCTGSGSYSTRWVVQAVLTAAWEIEPVEN